MIIVSTISRLHGGVGAAMAGLTEGSLARLIRGPAEVVGVLRPVLKVDEVGVFIADQVCLDKEVVLLLHQLLKDRLIDGSSHTDKELRVL